MCRPFFFGFGLFICQVNSPFQRQQCQVCGQASIQKLHDQQVCWVGGGGGGGGPSPAYWDTFPVFHVWPLFSCRANVRFMEYFCWSTEVCVWLMPPEQAGVGCAQRIDEVCGLPGFWGYITPHSRNEKKSRQSIHQQPLQPVHSLVSTAFVCVMREVVFLFVCFVVVVVV